MTAAPGDLLEGLPRSGEVLLDKYRIDRLIGVGGMGAVVEAWHLSLEERVAIKFLLPALCANEEAVGRFEREARALFRLKSEHVCRVHDHGKLSSGVPFLVMEFLEGHDLASALARQAGMPVDLAVGYLLQACHAVAEAHARGIVHRDLKPENLFVCERADGEACVKVLDFGLSKIDSGAQGGTRERQLTAHQQAMGTPQYMAPEQWLDASDVGPKADQWALGAILFELLAGRPPFEADQIGGICMLALNAPTPSLLERRSDAPPGLEAVIRKCLEKQPRDRYQSVGAMAVALAAFSGSGAMQAAERLRAMLDRPDDSGAWREIDMPSRIPPAPSDMRATRRRLEKRAPLESGARTGRDSSQSWQQLLRGVAGAGRSSTATWVSAVTVVVVVTALSWMLASSAEPQPRPAESRLARALSTGALSASGTPSAVTPAVTTALPSASAAAVPRPRPQPRAPGSASAAASASAAPSSTSIFERRW
jgi:serine/threonine-protein kinase